MILYRPTDQQISTTLSDESVILNYNKGEYFTLNEVGTFIWERLNESPRSVSELAKLISEVYDITVDDCQADIEEIIIELENEKLVEKVQ